MNTHASPRPRALVARIGALGDVLLTRRLTFELSRRGERVTLLAPARHASLLRLDPWIDEVLDSESPRMAKAFLGMWPEEPRDFQRALVISQSMELGRAVVAAAGSVRMIPPSPPRDDVSVAEQWASAVTGPGAPRADLPVLPVESARAVARDAIVIHPGSGSATKNWRVAEFGSLARALRGAGLPVAWLRGPADTALPGAPDNCLPLDGLSLDELAATLAHARLFIGNDSGVAHLAGAVGAPTLALFGPTNAAVWQPDGPRVRVVRAPGGDLSTLRATDVDEVARALIARPESR